MNSCIYLDNSTQTQPSPASVAAMMPYLTTYFGNPFSPHQKGQELVPPINAYLKTLHTCLEANEEATFKLTASGTEAIYHVFDSVYRNIVLPTGKNQLLCSQTAPMAILKTCASFESLGCFCKTMNPSGPDGITLKTVIESISPRTALISLSWACGLTGHIQPLSDIAKLCHERDIKLHIDVSHALGQSFCELQEICPDYLTLDGNAFHAPIGSGLLLTSHSSPRSNTERLNVASLAALTTAIQATCSHCDSLNTETARLRNKLEEGICEQVNDAQICFKSQMRLPHCTTLLFPHIYNETFLFALNRKQVFASMGGIRFQPLWLILNAHGFEKKSSHTALSFSLSYETTEDEIDRAIDIITETALKLKRLA